MAKSVKYDRIFDENARACGDPFPEILAVLMDAPVPARILDLGCGQGRDALPAARRGHRVVGVDISRVGVGQLNAVAEAEGLELKAVVADVVAYQPEGVFDVVVLDRVLHMLASEADRRAVLRKSLNATTPGAQVLIADTPANIPEIERFVSDEAHSWAASSPKRGLLFLVRPGS